jgi:hypothetical protein
MREGLSRGKQCPSVYTIIITLGSLKRTCKTNGSSFTLSLGRNTSAGDMFRRTQPPSGSNFSCRVNKCVMYCVRSRHFRRVGEVAKRDYYLRYICPSFCLSVSPCVLSSVCPHGKILLLSLEPIFSLFPWR